MPVTLKKAQITVFVIIAILIVASVSIFLYLRVRPTAIPAEFRPVENYFLSCIENKVREGASLLGSQAGYIELPKFEAGSEYMPFSSQLNFLGTAVPYWFYISGNNIMKTQIPSISSMEKQLSNFLNEEIKNCDFSEFEYSGYDINIGDVKTIVKINDNNIEVSVDAPLAVNYGDASARITKHDTEVESKIGKFYDIAKRVYDKEQKELFLENYTLDVISLYAPNTNVELSCAPKTWSKKEVQQGLEEAISANIAALKFEGSYYKLNNNENKYFVINDAKKTDESVDFMYSDSWPIRFEVWPSDGDVMKAEPIGTQDGLGVLGFCYVQYHFVYDIAYPVMIQLFNDNELFQFPVLVYINKNKAREAEKTEAVESIEAEICRYKLTDTLIETINTSASPVEADVNFKCFDQICEIGKTKIINGQAVLEAKVPQCIGGFVVANANGYAEGKMQVDTNEPAYATVILPSLFSLDLDVFVGGAPMAKEENALITFTSEEGSTTVVYPQVKRVELSEGFYNISVYIYRQGNINLGSYKTQQCIKVPAEGIGGIFGFEKEQCYDVEIPSQTLTQIVSGGGNTQEYLSENMLGNAKKISIYASVMPLPQNILELQQVYELVDTSEVMVELS